MPKLELAEFTEIISNYCAMRNYCWVYIYYWREICFSFFVHVWKFSK